LLTYTGVDTSVSVFIVRFPVCFVGPVYWWYNSVAVVVAVVMIATTAAAAAVKVGHEFRIMMLHILNKQTIIAPRANEGNGTYVLNVSQPRR